MPLVIGAKKGLPNFNKLAMTTLVQVTRKPYTRRKIKADVWKYHLRQMAAAEDPIQYLCRFLPRQDQAALCEPVKEPVAAQA